MQELRLKTEEYDLEQNIKHVVLQVKGRKLKDVDMVSNLQL